MPTWLVRFDEDGVCTSPATKTALLQQLAAGDYTDILFYSHGWNTDFDAAVEQYSAFLTAFEKVIGDYPLQGFKPVFVGITWPSVWWPSTQGPQMAGAGATAEPIEQQVLREIGARLSASDREKLYAAAAETVLDTARALEMAALVAPAMNAPVPAAGDAGEAGALKPEDILVLAESLRRAETPAPVDDGDDLDEVGTHGSAAMPATLAAAGGSFDPLSIIKLASLFQMKDRAARVGARGVATLLRELLGVAGRRLHVFGHSFGAKVMLSALAAPAALSRKPESLLLLQPAISHLAFADNSAGIGHEGGYRTVLGRVGHPMLTTYSKMDFPLHEVFHWALRRPADVGEALIAAAGATSAGNPPNKYAALGGYGPRSSGESGGVDPIPAPGTDYPDFTGVVLLGLDGSNGLITSHGDVANPRTAWALRALIARSMP
jgi:hypothetical protein